MCVKLSVCEVVCIWRVCVCVVCVGCVCEAVCVMMFPAAGAVGFCANSQQRLTAVTCCDADVGPLMGQMLGLSVWS